MNIIPITKSDTCFNLPSTAVMDTNKIKIKWIVVGGIPRQSIGDATVTLGLKKIGEYYTLDKAKKAVNDNFNVCGGIISYFSVTYSKI